MRYASLSSSAHFLSCAERGKLCASLVWALWFGRDPFRRFPCLVYGNGRRFWVQFPALSSLGELQCFVVRK
jgi:hypothetical protein